MMSLLAVRVLVFKSEHRMVTAASFSIAVI